MVQWMESVATRAFTQGRGVRVFSTNLLRLMDMSEVSLLPLNLNRNTASQMIPEIQY